MMGLGGQVYLMVEDHIRRPTEISMMEPSKMVSNMDRENNTSAMGTAIRVIMGIMFLKVLEYMFGLMGANMKVILNRGLEVAMGNGLREKVCSFIVDVMQWIKSGDMVNIVGVMGSSTRDSLKMILGMDRESCFKMGS
jgi:hypothetical protein